MQNKCIHITFYKKMRIESTVEENQDFGNGNKTH